MVLNADWCQETKFLLFWVGKFLRGGNKRIPALRYAFWNQFLVVNYRDGFAPHWQAKQFAFVVKRINRAGLRVRLGFGIQVFGHWLEHARRNELANLIVRDRGNQIWTLAFRRGLNELIPGFAQDHAG